MVRKSLVLALIVAGGALTGCDPPPPRPWYGPNPHVRWCLDHHPGYDPRTNLFPDAAGRPRECRGPAFGPPRPPPAY